MAQGGQRAQDVYRPPTMDVHLAAKVQLQVQVLPRQVQPHGHPQGRPREEGRHRRAPRHRRQAHRRPHPHGMDHPHRPRAR